MCMLGDDFTGVLASAAWADQPPGTTTLNDVRVESIASDRLSVDVVVLPQNDPGAFLVRDTALQDSLKDLHKGDRLSVLVVTDNGQTTLQAMSVKVVSVGVRYRALALFGAAIAFWLVCFLLSGFHPQKLIMGEDGRFSNSKFQTVLWFGVLVVSYLATLWLRARELGGDMLGGSEYTPEPLPPLGDERRHLHRRQRNHGDEDSECGGSRCGEQQTRRDRAPSFGPT